MSLIKAPAHQTSVDRFRDNHLFILEKNVIPKNSIPWYRKYVEAYIKANNNTLLSNHTDQDVDCNLNAKG